MVCECASYESIPLLSVALCFWNFDLGWIYCQSKRYCPLLIRLTRIYIGHRLVVRPESDNTFWTGSTNCIKYGLTFTRLYSKPRSMVSRQCVCCFREPRNYERFGAITQSVVLMAVCQLRDLTNSLEARCGEYPE